MQCTLNLEESRCHLQAIELLGWSLAARLSLETVDAVLFVEGTAATQPKTNLHLEGQAVSTLRTAAAVLCCPNAQCFTGRCFETCAAGLQQQTFSTLQPLIIQETLFSYKTVCPIASIATLRMSTSAQRHIRVMNYASAKHPRHYACDVCLGCI